LSFASETLLTFSADSALETREDFLNFCEDFSPSLRHAYCFAHLTFGGLLLLRVSAPMFRTAWFLESVLSEILILLMIRTRRPFFRSGIGFALLWASVGVAAGTLIIPYTPLGPLLGFVPLLSMLVAGVCGIVALYVVAWEASKRVIFRKAPL
jgi:Mg2+-importing ATPase